MSSPIAMTFFEGGRSYLNGWYASTDPVNTSTPAPERHRNAELAFKDRLRHWAITPMFTTNLTTLLDQAIKWYCPDRRRGKQNYQIATSLDVRFFNNRDSPQYVDYRTKFYGNYGWTLERMHSYFAITPNDVYDRWMNMSYLHLGTGYVVSKTSSVTDPYTVRCWAWRANAPTGSAKELSFDPTSEVKREKDRFMAEWETAAEKQGKRNEAEIW
ncbi:MAG: hypothetical protein Q9221_009013 [Calogaya cf. arnoldii]